MTPTQQRACSDGMRRVWRRRHATLRRQMRAVAEGRADIVEIGGVSVELAITPHDWWHILQKCRQVLKPQWERGPWGAKRWYIWRDAQGRQIHAALDNTNLPSNVVQAALNAWLAGMGAAEEAQP